LVGARARWIERRRAVVSSSRLAAASRAPVAPPPTFVKPPQPGLFFQKQIYYIF